MRRLALLIAMLGACGPDNEGNCAIICDRDGECANSLGYDEDACNEECIDNATDDADGLCADAAEVYADCIAEAPSMCKRCVSEQEEAAKACD